MNQLYFISRYHTLRKANCEIPMRHQVNQFMLLDDETDHCQHTGIHFD